MPFKLAVIVANWSEGIAPVLAVKVAELALAGTVTEEGTVNTDGALLARLTTVPLLADLDRVTVQVALALEARVEGAH
jgi:phosphoenolpyruvate-protein kinase (PTS system EI component)